MAKARRGPESIGGYFRMLFAKHPELLKPKTNPEIVAHWEEDHPGEKITDRIRANMANVKSQVKSKRRKGRGRKKAATESAMIVVGTTARVNSKRPTLQTLEFAIDDCMTMAKNIDRDVLAEVILRLRKARNLVVYQSGER